MDLKSPQGLSRQTMERRVRDVVLSGKLLGTRLLYSDTLSVIASRWIFCSLPSGKLLETITVLNM